MILACTGWQACVEQLILSWIDDPAGVDRAELETLCEQSLPALLHTADLRLPGRFA